MHATSTEIQISIGHSSHPMDRLLDLLQQHGIEASWTSGVFLRHASTRTSVGKTWPCRWRTKTSRTTGPKPWAVVSIAKRPSRRRPIPDSGTVLVSAGRLADTEPAQAKIGPGPEPRVVVFTAEGTFVDEATFWATF